MSDFWPLAMLLILVALLFVVVPLLLKPKIRGVRRDALNVQVIKDQLNELQADLQSGRLAESAYADARHDLERQLLDDVAVAGAPDEDNSGRGRWLLVVLMLLVPVTAVFIYQQTGGQQEAQSQVAGNAMAPASDDTAHSVEEMIVSLAARLQQDPENIDGWVMLARSYAAINRYRESAAAYQRAMQLSADDAEILSSYVDVLVLAQDGNFSDEVGTLLDRAVAADPRHLKSRWLRGHWKARRGDAVGAVEDWQIALALLPPGSESSVVIQQQISAVQGGAVKPAETAASGGGAAISVRVELDPALQGKVDPNDTVFIFARPAQGGRMPLAAVRKRVADLPLTVTLDDSMSMSPAMVLSKFDQVTVSARISKSGQAIPASGDLQGSVSPVAVTSNSEVLIRIDQQLP